MKRFNVRSKYIFFMATLLEAGCGSHTPVQFDQQAPQQEQALISDIASMTARIDGSFDVVCKDGSKEVKTAKEISDNNVCNKPSPPSPVCTGSSLTQAEAISLLPAGGSSAFVGTYDSRYRWRRCGPSGCIPWSSTFTTDIESGAQVNMNNLSRLWWEKEGDKGYFSVVYERGRAVFNVNSYDTAIKGVVVPPGTAVTTPLKLKFSNNRPALEGVSFLSAYGEHAPVSVDVDVSLTKTCLSMTIYQKLDRWHDGTYFEIEATLFGNVSKP